MWVNIYQYPRVILSASKAYLLIGVNICCGNVNILSKNRIKSSKKPVKLLEIINTEYLPNF